MFKTKFLTGAILVLVLMFLTVSVMGVTPDLELGGLEPIESVYLGSVETAETESAERAALFSDIFIMENSAQSIIVIYTKNESRNAVSVTLFHDGPGSTVNRFQGYIQDSGGLKENKFIYLA